LPNASGAGAAGKLSYSFFPPFPTFSNFNKAKKIVLSNKVRFEDCSTLFKPKVQPSIRRDKPKAQLSRLQRAFRSSLRLADGNHGLCAGQQRPGVDAAVQLLRGLLPFPGSAVHLAVWAALASKKAVSF
jgi:hypothetical protein